MATLKYSDLHRETETVEYTLTQTGWKSQNNTVIIDIICC